MNQVASKDDQIIRPEQFKFNSPEPQQPKYKIRFHHLFIAAALFVAGLALVFVFIATSLQIKVDQPAQVKVEGPLALPLGDRFLLIPGQYQISATYPGFQKYYRQIDTREQDYFDLQIQMQLLPGRLNIKTKVAGEVFEADKRLGETGQILTDLAPGTHQMIVKAPRYQDAEFAVNIKGKDLLQSMEVELTPAWGTVMVDSLPSGANVVIEGKAIGQTPYQFELLQGEHRISLELAGYQTWHKRIDVEAQQSLTLPTVHMAQSSARLNLDSVPQQANVTLDGQYLGKTPLNLALSGNKPHKLLVVKEGYQALSHEITLAPSSARSLSLPLKPTLGKVTFTSKHKDALLYVNGHLMGRAQQTLSLPTRPHRIEVRLEGYQTFKTQVLPRSGKGLSVPVKLITLEQARFEALPKQLVSAAGQRLKLFHPQVKFQMGASRREQGRRANETLRQVSLTRPFYLGETEVTNSQFRQFSEFHSSSHVDGSSLDGASQPVVNVTWLAAAQYCNWLSEQDGLDSFYQIEDDKLTGFNAQARGYRLPTEAEWAWAARFYNQSMRQFNWGKQLPPANKVANIAGIESAAIVGHVMIGYEDKHRVSAPVASYGADGKGLYDLMGNVSEWIHDHYEIHSGLSFKTLRDPLGASTGKHHVIRGASWAHGRLTELRFSYRDYGDKGRRDLGFRLARYSDLPVNQEKSTQ